MPDTSLRIDRIAQLKIVVLTVLMSGCSNGLSGGGFHGLPPDSPTRINLGKYSYIDDELVISAVGDPGLINTISIRNDSTKNSYVVSNTKSPSLPIHIKLNGNVLSDLLEDREEVQGYSVVTRADTGEFSNGFFVVSDKDATSAPPIPPSKVISGAGASGAPTSEDEIARLTAEIENSWKIRSARVTVNEIDQTQIRPPAIGIDATVKLIKLDIFGEIPKYIIPGDQNMDGREEIFSPRSVSTVFTSTSPLAIIRQTALR